MGSQSPTWKARRKEVGKGELFIPVGGAYQATNHSTIIGKDWPSRHALFDRGVGID